MHLRHHLTAAVLLVTSALLSSSHAQEVVQGYHVDAATGINITTWSSIPNEEGLDKFTFGMALPTDAASKNATEFIGYLRCQSISAERTGWCGISVAGGMIDSLLLVVYPWEGKVLSSFRVASDYFLPDAYTGTATLTQITSSVNATSYEVLFRCQNCFTWDQGGLRGTVPTVDAEIMVLGRAQAADAPVDGACPFDMTFGYHAMGFGMWGVGVEDITTPSYAAWAATANKTVRGDC